MILKAISENNTPAEMAVWIYIKCTAPGENISRLFTALSDQNNLLFQAGSLTNEQYLNVCKALAGAGKYLADKTGSFVNELN